MKIPNTKYHLSVAEKNGICFRCVVRSVAHNRISTIVFRIRNLLCNVPDVLQLLFCCFDPPPWRGNIYDVVKTEPHPVASRSNKPQLWILDIVRKFCQRITVFLLKDFQCVNVFLSSALHLLRYPHQ